jgi:uncharacterized membrane protein
MTGVHDFDRLEYLLTGVMRIGLALSTLVLLVGLVMALAGLPASAHVLNAGIVLLMLIPATRIVVSLIDAALRRDALLAFATSIVILVLASQIASQFLDWFRFK